MKAAILVAVAMLTSLHACAPAWAHPGRPRGEELTHTAAQAHSARTARDHTPSAPIPRSNDRHDSRDAPSPDRGRGEPRLDEAARALLLGALVLVALARPARRRSHALALVAILVVLAFESGVHSVHHLDSPADAARCAVAAAASHTPGLLGDITASLVGPGLGRTALLVVAEAQTVPGIPRAFQSRAPPFPSLARA